LQRLDANTEISRRLAERNILVIMPMPPELPVEEPGLCAAGDGIVFQFEQNPTFCRFDEWKAVFRRTTGDAKPPLFRPL
jgi:hypothetical protein